MPLIAQTSDQGSKHPGVRRTACRPDADAPGLPRRATGPTLDRPGHRPDQSTSLVVTVPAVRPGALWYVQYRFVCAMTLSGGGAPHSV